MTSQKVQIILNRAARFAVKVHEGQFRKDGVTPYCVHPLRVGNLLANHHAKPYEILCGLWHDILEDCPDKCEDLGNELNSYGFHDYLQTTIICTLESLIKPSTGNREERNKQFTEQIIRGGNSAILIKICDRIDNVMDSPGLGDFAELYVVHETGYLVNELKKLRPSPEWFDALQTLIIVRDEEISRNGWKLP